jgi:protein-disulfide isomerase
LVQDDFERGQSISVNGTPTFLINDQVLVGLQPLGVFENAIEDARRKAEDG